MKKLSAIALGLLTATTATALPLDSHYDEPNQTLHILGETDKVKNFKEIENGMSFTVVTESSQTSFISVGTPPQSKETINEVDVVVTQIGDLINYTINSEDDISALTASGSFLLSDTTNPPKTVEELLENSKETAIEGDMLMSFSEVEDMFKDFSQINCPKPEFITTKFQAQHSADIAGGTRKHEDAFGEVAFKMGELTELNIKVNYDDEGLSLLLDSSPNCDDLKHAFSEETLATNAMLPMVISMGGAALAPKAPELSKAITGAIPFLMSTTATPHLPARYEVKIPRESLIEEIKALEAENEER